MNIANLIRGGDFKFETPEDEQLRAEREYARLKADGKIQSFCFSTIITWRGQGNTIRATMIPTIGLVTNDNKINPITLLPFVSAYKPTKRLKQKQRKINKAIIDCDIIVLLNFC